jgi:hypothetical protein
MVRTQIQTLQSEIGKLNYSVSHLNFSFPMAFFKKHMSEKAYDVFFSEGSYFFYEPDFESSCYNREYRNEFCYEDGTCFIGQWAPGTDQRQGRGVQIMPDGSLFEGYFQDDKFTHLGRYIHADGTLYLGGFEEGLFSG